MRLPKIMKALHGQNNVKPVLAVILLITIWYVLIGKDLLADFSLKNVGNSESVEKMYYEFPCSEANFARLIALTMSKEIETSSEDTLWYEKYYNAIEGLGVHSLKKEDAFQIVSSKQFEKVLDELVNVNVNIEHKERMNLYEVIEAYERCMVTFNKDYQPIEYETVAILLTPTDEMSLPAWEVMTDQGNFNFEGVVVDPLKNMTIQIACVNHQMLGIMEIKSKSCRLEDCKIIEVDRKKVKVEIEGNLFEYDNQGVNEEEIGKIGRLTLENGAAAMFESQRLELDTLLGVSEHEIILEKAGKLEYNELIIEDETSKGIYNHVSDLCYGLKVAYTTHEGEVTRLEVVNETNLKEIRVVLHNEEAQNYLHEEVRLKSQQDYDMVIDGKATTLAADEEWSAKAYDWKENSRVRFVPREEASQMQVLTLLRNHQIPSYSGIIEVIKDDKGYSIVNEVDLEDYVAGVLPSEMPTSYGEEALKAQAIAIRTYGVAAKRRASFLAYGAHVDDTTATQVYNRLPIDDKALSAVKETKGLVLKSEGKLIQNKYFATSCGYTANSGEVWAAGDFPGKTLDYLVSRQQYRGDKLGSPKDELVFKKFINLTAEDLDAFDEASPWFRWRVELSRDALRKLLVPAIRQLVDEKNTKIECKLNGDKTINYESIEQLGEIKEIKVLERGEGGNVMRLEIIFEKGSIIAQTEYVIRRLFSSNENQSLMVIRSDGSKVDEMNLLPSAFFTIEEEKDQEDQIENIILVGGGNGHGVGLSQDGAKGMAQRGYRYDEILEHYYKNCEIELGE